MKNIRIYYLNIAVILFFAFPTTAQVGSGVYMNRINKFEQEIVQEVKLSKDYFILSEYRVSPPEFIRTVGGYYETSDDRIKVSLEFNSNYASDSISRLDIPYSIHPEGLKLILDQETVFAKQKSNKQDLDGAWLFATRGPDKGQERRGDSRARKTLKFLIDGHFQWIAYTTGSFKFSGTGGGHYIANSGTYTENIGYFSRDNSRVGAELGFSYEVKGKDWHHQGKNSRGEPMYEIWARRD